MARRGKRAVGALAAALLAVVVLPAAPAAGANQGPSGKLVAAAEERVLRLHDLPPGYVIVDSSCEAWSPAEEDRGPLDRWILKYWPEGCDFSYEQLFQVPSLSPSPPVAVAQVTNTPSEASAEIGFGLILRELAADIEVKDGGSVSIGPAGPVAHIFRVRFRSSFGTAIFWRQGRLIAGVASHGMKPPENDQAALHLAQVQQGRIDAPSPYTEAERDDREVPLDDPGLKVNVYWTGNPFRPGHGLPATKLEKAFKIEGPLAGPPGQKLNIYYEDFSLGTWTRQSWKRYKQGVVGARNLRARCARTTTVPLERGQAIVYAGYRRVRLRACPDGPPDRYWAVAHIGREVVGVNFPNCIACFGPESGPYDSLRGMKAILRGLTLRPQPVYAAP